MNEFEFLQPESLSEALFQLSDANGEIAVLAGGTDLLLRLRAGDQRPGCLMSLQRLGELQGIEYDAHSGLRVGALVTLRQLVRSPLVQRYYPCLAEAAGRMASEQVRSLATVGGNLCNAAPSADLAPPLLALEARACITRVDGAEWLPLEDFFLGPGHTVLQKHELLKEIRIPPPEGTAAYLRHTPRAFMDIAVVGVAARVWMQAGSVSGARIALGAVAPTPLRAKRAEAELIGGELTDEQIGRAAALAEEACSPIDDVRGSAWYRRRMVRVLTRRILEQLRHVLAQEARA